jgi:hypothetical protein
VNGPGSGSRAKTAGVDFTASFQWVVDCDDGIVFARGTFNVTYNPPPPPPPPGTHCTDPPEWLSPPTISGTPAFGNSLTVSSGEVSCAEFVRATFYWTNAAGNILGTAKTGAVQACPDPEHFTCTKTDSYALTTADEGSHIKATWTAWRGNSGPAEASTGRVGPLPAVNAVTYAVYLDGAYFRTFEIPYPGCGVGALCANVSSGVEPQGGGFTCPTFDIHATGFSASGGSRNALTPNFHQAGRDLYPSVYTRGQPGPTEWNIVVDEALFSCIGDYWILTDQGVRSTFGLPAIVTGPPFSLGVTLAYQRMNPHEGLLYVPALWAIGAFYGTSSDSWIEVGYFSGALCGLDPTRTYFYIETVSSMQGTNDKVCVKPEDGRAVAQYSSPNRYWNIYLYDPPVRNPINGDTTHRLELRFVSFR